jgi:uncharacterized beta-barrel protein YwiB (DUF1934 family)
MKFIISQRTTDYYVIEADSEEEAYELVTSGEFDVSNTKYEDFNTESVET